MMISATKIFHFEMAHALTDHPGACRNLHGHSYEMHVSVTAPELNSQGMIIDFGDIKRLVKEHILDLFDHALTLKRGTPLAQTMDSYDGKMVWLYVEPTAENLAQEFADILTEVFTPLGITLSHIKLYETPTSYVTWQP